MSTKSGGAHVYEALRAAGVELLVGLPGTQTLPLDRVVAAREEMRYVMARHETAIPHVAWGYYEASGRPAATLTVPGPGDTNAMHGLKNALEDCVPILHVSADVNPEDRGKGPIHEIEPDTFDNAVKANLNVERARDLPATVARGVELATTPPYGPVRLGVPSGVLAAEFEAPAASVTPEATTYDNGPGYDRAATLLRDAERPAVYVGGGVRRSPEGPAAVGELIEALDAPVCTSYKGKGVVPEDDPRWLGVTGSHLPAGARRVLDAADVVLAFGTDFDGVTTAGWSLPMGDRLVHVTLDADAVDAAYGTEVAVVADAGEAARTLRDRVEGAAGGWDGAAVGEAVRAEYRDRLVDEGLLGDATAAPARTPALCEAVRAATPRETPVTFDVGGFRLWAMQAFPAYGPERLVAAGSWAGMGVGLPAAVGAALATDGPVVSLAGDGGLMMAIHELHTAVEEGLDVTVVVSNNADYGVISKSPEIEAYAGAGRFAWGSPDFATVAEGFGCEATRVETAAAAGEVVADAVGNGRVTLVDVAVDPEEPSAAAFADYESTVDV
jgi:acetolactate synthase-1/2/3 large subunit